MIEVSRRRLLGFLAAPAIVHAANLMPIKPWRGVAIKSIAHPIGEWVIPPDILLHASERFSFGYTDSRFLYPAAFPAGIESVLTMS